MWVQSLGWEDRLEKEMATLSSIPAWEIPWTEEPGRPQTSQRVRHRHKLNGKTTRHRHKLNGKTTGLGERRNRWRCGGLKGS